MTDERWIYGRIPKDGTRTGVAGELYVGETVPLTLFVNGRQVGTVTMGVDGTLEMLTTDQEIARTLKPRLRRGDVGV